MLRLHSIAVPLDEDDIDSGRIFPSRFLRKPYADGYADFLFHDDRRGADGRKHGAHPLDNDAHRKAEVLVTGHNFGCGSSRESAVYAIRDAGFRCIIAGSFGEIFEANCRRNGLLAITLSSAALRQLMDQLRNAPGTAITVDVEQQRIVFPDGEAAPFYVDMHALDCFKTGYTEMEAAEKFMGEIDEFRRRYEQAYPWLLP